MAVTPPSISHSSDKILKLENNETNPEPNSDDIIRFWNNLLGVDNPNPEPNRTDDIIVATPPSSSYSSDKILKLEHNETNPNPNPEPNDDNPLKDFLKNTSLPFQDFPINNTSPLGRLAEVAVFNADMAAAAFGLEGSLGWAFSFAKRIAVATRIYELTTFSLKSLRGKEKDDDYFSNVDAGVAGCFMGLALEDQPPLGPIHRCILMGGIVSIGEMLCRTDPALAHSSSLRSKRSQNHFAGALPHLALPLPNELKESFSYFCEAIRKCNKTNGQAGPC